MTTPDHIKPLTQSHETRAIATAWADAMGKGPISELSPQDAARALQVAQRLTWKGYDAKADKVRRDRHKAAYETFKGECYREADNRGLGGGLGGILYSEIEERFQDGDDGGADMAEGGRHRELCNVIQTDSLMSEVVSTLEQIRLEPAKVTADDPRLVDLLEEAALHDALTAASTLSLATGAAGAGVAGWWDEGLPPGTEAIPAHMLIALPMPNCPSRPGAIVRLLEGGGYLYYDIRDPAFPVCRAYEKAWDGNPWMQEPKSDNDGPDFRFKESEEDGSFRAYLPIQLYPYRVGTGELLPVAYQLYQRTIDLMVDRTRIAWIQWAASENMVVILSEKGNIEVESAPSPSDPRPVIVLTGVKGSDKVIDIDSSADTVEKLLASWGDDWDRAARQYHGDLMAQKSEAAHSGVALTIREGKLYRERLRQESIARRRDYELIEALVAADNARGANVEPISTEGLSIIYPQTMSREDKAKTREELVKDVEAGRRTLVELEMFDSPDLTEEEAAAVVVGRIKQTQALKETGDTSKEYSAALASSLLLLVGEAQAKRVPREGAKGLMKTIYGLSDDVAVRLLPAVTLEPPPEDFIDEADPVRITAPEEVALAAGEGLNRRRLLAKEERDSIIQAETDMARALAGQVDMAPVKVRELQAWHRMNPLIDREPEGTVGNVRYLLHGGGPGKAWAEVALLPPPPEEPAPSTDNQTETPAPEGPTDGQG